MAAVTVADDIPVSGVAITANDNGGGAEFVELGGDPAALGTLAEQFGRAALAVNGGALAELVPGDVGGAGHLPGEAACFARQKNVHPSYVNFPPKTSQQVQTIRG